MSTTLHAHPPHRLDESPSVQRIAPLSARRPTALDKLALHLGLLLITYGRRRYALSREELSRGWANDEARRRRELDWARARHLLTPAR